MITKPLTVTELKEIFLENLINKTDNLSKVANNSVLNAVAFGISKIGQKAMKDIALVESHLFIDSAINDNLDLIAERSGIAARFGVSESSTYVKLVGDAGTFYEAGVNNCSGSHGIVFEFDEDITIGVHGFAYARVRSVVSGSQTNVDPLSINLISPIPEGHDYIVNEVMATGGRDSEDDVTFRKRIKEGINLCARGTISYLEQVFMKINSDILRVFYLGTNDSGKTSLSVVTQNGVALTSSELLELVDKANEYLSITELSSYGRNSIGITLSNSQWEYIDMDFRVQLESEADTEEVRKNIQVRISKYLDFRFWDYNKKVEWDDLLNIVKTTNQVKAVSDNTFSPDTDTTVSYTKLPRLRSFTMRDLDGAIIEDVTGYLNSVYYPSAVNVSYQMTILGNI